MVHARNDSHSTDMHDPDSMTVRYAGDVRIALMTGRTFAMQVAHPAVGAGVGQLSNFRKDPWRRLREVRRSGRNMMFSGKEGAIAEGARLRRIHRNIKGRDSHGNPYHSLDPDVYGWVHTVFFDTTVTMHRLYGTPLSREEERRLFAEWRQGGRFFGLSDEDMPATVEDYWAFYHHMIETTLEYNDVVAKILSEEPLVKPAGLSWLPDAAWQWLWKPVGKASHRLIMSSLPDAYREKIAPYQPWTDEDRRRMERFQRWVRATVPGLPRVLRFSPDARRAMRAA